MKLLRTEAIIGRQRTWNPLINKALKKGKVIAGKPPDKKNIKDDWTGYVAIWFEGKIIILWDLSPSPGYGQDCGMSFTRSEVSAMLKRIKQKIT